MPRGGQNRLDLTLQTFGRLRALNAEPSDAKGQARWLCLCECGNKTVVLAYSLRSGNTRSCGCMHRETLRDRSTRHGHAHSGNKSRTYNSWQAMWARCTKPDNTNFANYGGRGIKVCDRWQKFDNFLADMGERPEGHTIDRRDNEAGYSPENCRWATRKEQLANRRPTHATRVSKSSAAASKSES